MRTIVKHFFFSKQTLIIQFENVNFSSRLADIAFLCHLLLGRLLEHNPHFLLSPMLPWRLVSLVEKRQGELPHPHSPAPTPTPTPTGRNCCQMTAVTRFPMLLTNSESVSIRPFRRRPTEQSGHVATLAVIDATPLAAAHLADGGREHHPQPVRPAGGRARGAPRQPGRLPAGLPGEGDDQE